MKMNKKLKKQLINEFKIDFIITTITVLIGLSIIIMFLIKG